VIRCTSPTLLNIPTSTRCDCAKLDPETYDFSTRDHAQAAIFDYIELFTTESDYTRPWGIAPRMRLNENGKVFKWYVRKGRGSSV
jgi:hypothetical protein